MFARLLVFVTLVFLETVRGTSAQESHDVKIAYLYQAEKGRLTISILDRAPIDRGLAGAKVAINDNNTTGKFVGQSFILTDVGIAPEADPVAETEKLLAGGNQFIIADLPAAAFLKVADTAKGKGVLVFNAGAFDDTLREQDCRANVIHTAPTYSMLADGLGQYLVWKRWRNWFLVEGSHPDDKLWGAALRRAAERFGAKIVFAKEFTDTGGARQSDSGTVQIQRQIPVFTQDAPDHDVLVAPTAARYSPPIFPIGPGRRGRSSDRRVSSRRAGIRSFEAVGRGPDPEPVRKGYRPPYAQCRHAGVDGGSDYRRGRHPDQVDKREGYRGLHQIADDFSLAAFKGEKLRCEIGTGSCVNLCYLPTAALLYRFRRRRVSCMRSLRTRHTGCGPAGEKSSCKLK